MLIILLANIQNFALSKSIVKAKLKMKMQPSNKAHQFDFKVTDGVLLKDLNLWEQTSQYCMDSSLHGFRFIGQPKRHFVER